MSAPNIKTPRQSTFHTSGCFGTLAWAADFGPQHTQNFHRAQCFVDSEVLRLSDPYTPMRNGVLIRSGISSTDIGSGEVCYDGTPYGAHHYYTPDQDFNGAPMRGAYWFERMKIDHIGDIRDSTAAVLGVK